MNASRSPWVRTALLFAVVFLLPIAGAQAARSPSETRSAGKPPREKVPGKRHAGGHQEAPPSKSPPAQPAPKVTEITAPEVRVVGVASDQLSLDVAISAPQACRQVHLVVDDMLVKDRLKPLRPGDHITVVYSNEASGQNVLKAFCVDTRSAPVGRRVWTLILSGFIYLLFYSLFAWRLPWKTIIGMDNRYSNSQFQIALWFAVLVTTYVATTWLRVHYLGWSFIAGVSIPQNLLALSGMSAFTFGGARLITAGKTGATPKQRAPAPSFLKDLTHNDGNPAAADPAQRPPQFDFGDFQMFVITLLAVAVYIVVVFNFLGTVAESKTISLPDVDTTILAAFVLSHGAYLGKKTAGPAGQS